MVGVFVSLVQLTLVTWSTALRSWGSPVKNGKWKKESWFDKRMSSLRNFARVCLTENGFIWEKITWATFKFTRNLFECDFEPEESPEDGLLETNKCKEGYKVFIERSKGYISGKPLAQGSYPMITACSRFCHERDGCKVFNHSSETKQCRLFGSVDDCLVEVDEKWVIWAAIIRK